MTTNEENLNENKIYKTKTTKITDEPELKNAKTLNWEYVTNKEIPRRRKNI